MFYGQWMKRISWRRMADTSFLDKIDRCIHGEYDHILPGYQYNTTTMSNSIYVII